jgi:hypothetical protein
MILIALLAIITFLALLKAALTLEKFAEQYQYYRTKCFSCEQDLIKRYGSPAYAYLGQPTKGFAEERELIARTGNTEAAFSAHPL